MTNNLDTNVGGLNFGWELNKGKFLFEGQDAVLFWITSAMRTFFDTIEEISGEEASQVVFETTGYRQGLVVGQYFEKMKDLNVAKAAEMITNTYASAGWGIANVVDINFEDKTVVIKMKDSWEYKINIAQEKVSGGYFLAAHYAGVFTELFGTTIWYNIVQNQLDGNEHSIIEYFPSKITATENIHTLARKKEAEQISQLEEMVNAKTKELRDLVKRLSSPIIPVLEGIVVVPLIGNYDEERSEDLIVNTLHNLPQHKANFLVLDLTGIDPDINHHTVNLIEKIGSAATLIGTQTVLVGLSPELGISISQSNINLTRFEFFQTLQHGIHHALAQAGRSII
ncbi:STAS domain-containing protein [Mesobacillus foraminis]|uniref:STAS domain-containing protein n=1 Tax=Mesobacillus foraminis TaxID=279826 RepID=UPI001BED1C70|nr:STAS domain-containing protein [Mesobacillus foraminis]MBT2756896.1 STAS domain-containing protein [Mesobacillus foraminis]